jgi:hypothetical protein
MQAASVRLLLETQRRVDAEIDDAIESDLLVSKNLLLEEQIAQLEGRVFKKRLQYAMLQNHVDSLQNARHRLQRDGAGYAEILSNLSLSPDAMKQVQTVVMGVYLATESLAKTDGKDSKALEKALRDCQTAYVNLQQTFTATEANLLRKK